MHADTKHDLAYDKFYDYIDENTDLSKKDSKALAREYATAIAAGDQYVDQEKNILHKAGNNSVFHAFSQQDKVMDNNFVKNTYEIAGAILEDSSFSKVPITAKIGAYIIEPVKASAKYDSNVLDYVEIPKKYFDTSSGSAEEASLFLLGMGLHTIQDSVAHAYVTNGNVDHIRHTDDFGYYYDIDKKAMIELKSGQADERKNETIRLTNEYIDKILEDYGQQLLPEPKNK